MILPQAALIIIAASFVVLCILYWFARRKIKHHAEIIAQVNAEADQKIRAAQAQMEQEKQNHEIRIRSAQQLIDQQCLALKEEEHRIKEYYEGEVKAALSKNEESLAKAYRDIEALNKFQPLVDAETETRQVLAAAVQEANALRSDAQALLEQARLAAHAEKTVAEHEAGELKEQADNTLKLAAKRAAKIIADANINAERLAGDAYTALKEKDALEQAAKAIRNIIDGYGDRYVVPTKSLIDDLADGYGHMEAGRMLKSVREQTKHMVETGLAAECDYSEAYRRNTAIRFVVDAFNGRVDALLTEAEHENYGTIEQQIRDVFSIVNKNGEAFRNARILPSFLDARLAELHWAVLAFELRKKDREEQRRIKEQMREEEKARRDYERALRETEEEEARIKKALEKARQEVEHATAQERAMFEAQLASLTEQLKEAEERNQRALSMAQQTKKGNVYIISNIGSFGEEVIKIGMTRRLEPMDRIWELSDASVPFDFDVHALIPCDDAPALESLLHTAFEDQRINRVNYRKEFFRTSLERIRAIIVNRGIEAEFTMQADAHEYRETLKLNGTSTTERKE
jgi:hypothetical protein